MADGPGAELEALRQLVQRSDLRAALQLLNQRTSFRYTGLFSCDAQTLRSVCFYDRWNPEVLTCPEAPIQQTYCSIVESSNATLEVVDGRSDHRFPWLMDSAFASYCGVPVRNAAGRVIGTLCHFDHQPCQVARREFPLLTEAASLFVDAMASLEPAPDRTAQSAS